MSDDLDLSALRLILLDLLPDPVIAVDATGLIRFTNHPADFALGLNSDETRSRPIAEFIPNWNDICLILGQALPPDFSAIEREEVFLCPDGSQKSVWFNVRTLQLNAQKVYVIVFRDFSLRHALLEEKAEIIAELYRSQDAALNIMEDLVAQKRELALHSERLETVVQERTEALLHSKEKLRQSERLASIGALAAGVAHEINNPVGAIMLTAQNALSRIAELKSLNEATMLLERTCNKVVGNARRCSLIVKGILQFSRKQATEKSFAAINPIARAAVQLIQDSLDMRGSEVVCELEDPLPECPVNISELEQVFVNLIKNALESEPLGVQVFLVTKATEGGVMIEVRDNGAGISEDQLNHVFDPFFTTRQQNGGTGLGLSIVHGIIVEHQGTIEIESELGKGTSIKINLPSRLHLDCKR